MLAPVVAALLLALGDQPPADRGRAEELARAGRTTEAVALFERIAALDPADVDARLWLARLQLRLGRTEEAEAGFRSVIVQHPNDVDAHIGLGAALTRRGRIAEAIAVLRDVEADAGENADYFATLARAYRRAGDDRRATEYFARAKRLAPSDPDVVSGYEAVAHAYGHSIVFDGSGERASTDTTAGSGTLAISIRATPRLHLIGTARVQERSGTSDTLVGGGALWRVNHAATLMIRAGGGSGNVSLPKAELAAQIMGYAGAFEIGADLRRMSFADVDVTTASPVLAWDTGGRWRLDGRYTYSRSAFATSGESSGDSSVMVRDTWRAWRRVNLMLTYAYGIESFEQLTADRLGSLGATTLAGGLRISLPSLTQVTATWEHQWRSNDAIVDRMFVTFVQAFP